MKDSKNILFILIIAVILVLSVIRIQNNGFLFGTRNSIVLSESMVPEIPVASLLIEKKYNGEDLKVGDIITYSNSKFNNVKITHRIISLKSDGYITKGDNNKQDDGIVVNPNDIEGKVVFIFPYLIHLICIILFIGINFTFFNKNKKRD